MNETERLWTTRPHKVSKKAIDNYYTFMYVNAVGRRPQMAFRRRVGLMYGWTMKFVNQIPLLKLAENVAELNVTFLQRSFSLFTGMVYF